MGWIGLFVFLIIISTLLKGLPGPCRGIIVVSLIALIFIERIRRATSSQRHRTRSVKKCENFAREYKILGVSPTASDEEVKSAYRNLVKRHHPDILRANGASQKKIDKATQRMSKINAAWSIVKKKRGI